MPATSGDGYYWCWTSDSDAGCVSTYTKLLERAKTQTVSGTTLADGTISTFPVVLHFSWLEVGIWFLLSTTHMQFSGSPLAIDQSLHSIFTPRA
jgi:hypothetical protein